MGTGFALFSSEAELAGVDIAGCDIVEVYPRYDSPAQIAALLAATVAFDFLSLLARSRRRLKQMAKRSADQSKTSGEAKITPEDSWRRSQ